MAIAVDFQQQFSEYADFIPSQQAMLEWCNTAAKELDDNMEMTIRITDEAEMQTLNNTYRNKNQPTNVLSFAVDLPEDIDLPLLGDIVICAPVVNREAGEQNKSNVSHWAHIVVHGTLHLLGYDHVEEHEADEMENKEILILQKLGYKNPYLMTENK